MAGAYDHLFKLLIIGDSGEWARRLPDHVFFSSFALCVPFRFFFLFLCYLAFGTFLFVDRIIVISLHFNVCLTILQPKRAEHRMMFSVILRKY